MKNHAAGKQVRAANTGKRTQLPVNTDTNAPMTAGIFVMFLLFGCMGGWLQLANLRGAVIAQGAIAVEGQPKSVQHLDGGIISEIQVSDGDFVRRGDVLLKLDRTAHYTNQQVYLSRLREAVARRSRLRAERDGLPRIIWDEKILAALGVSQDPQIRQGHVRLFSARKDARSVQVRKLHRQTEQIENQISGTKALLVSKQSQMAMLEEELENLSKLKKQGLVKNTQYLSLQRNSESLNGELGKHRAEIARMTNSIKETEIKVLQVEHEARENVLNQLRETEVEINDMAHQLHATNQQLIRTDLKAPTSGLVHEMSVFTIGGVVNPGETILQIVPQDQQLIVEAKVEPLFIDQLYPSQNARLRFPAFNQRTTPELDGTVEAISADVVVDPATGLARYKVRIGMPERELLKLGSQQLIPGMPVEAFIQTENRTALNYITKPLTDQISRAFREE